MTSERTLATLFLTRDSGPVSLNDEGLVDWKCFCADVASAAERLAMLPGQRAALYETDTYRFSVWLFAAWQRGWCVCLPGDNTPATVEQVRDRVDCLLGELPGALGWRDWQQADPARLHALNPDMPAVEVFTSGSTGGPVAIPKLLRQLDAEACALDAVHSNRMGADATLVAMVSPQHIYGLLFRVLWPLLSGRASLNRTLRYPEELLALPFAGRFAVLSSPAFLKRLPSELDWSRIAKRCTVVFSAGSPLPAEAYEQTRDLLGATVLEIYGSSETGGMAWRSQPSDAWTLLPGVTVDMTEEGCLAVRSLFLPNEDWLQTADRVELSVQGFRLLGRADRIVKIEEKRISLTRLESALVACPGVREVRTLAIPGRRLEIGAVLVLDAEGAALLEKLGKFRMSQQLRARLANEFERIGLPRRWRFVAAMPCNSMGKTTENELLALFAGGEETLRHLPVVQSCVQDDNSVVLDLELRDIVYFNGHFPEYPILPGVALIDWAMHYAREYLAPPPRFLGMDAVKFQQVLRSAERVQLALKYDSEKCMLQFQYRTADKLCASGRFRFEKAEA